MYPARSHYVGFYRLDRLFLCLLASYLTFLISCCLCRNTFVMSGISKVRWKCGEGQVGGQTPCFDVFVSANRILMK